MAGLLAAGRLIGFGGLDDNDSKPLHRRRVVGRWRNDGGVYAVWGVEIRPDIAAVAERNIPGLRVIVSDVATVDYASLPKVDHLHASTVCKRASIANADAEEAPEDLESAEAVCQAIRIIRPCTFTLENVWGYREFESFKKIVRCLRELGYFVDWWHLNAANYGVPQTRKRLILIARLDRQPTKPQPTHSDTPDPWGVYKPWVGWYEAIEDLIDTLPESQFANWQLERLPVELKSMLLAQGGYDGQIVNRSIEEPSFTVTSNSNQAGVRAIITGGKNANQEWGKFYRDDNEPVSTVSGQDPRLKAFLLNDNCSSDHNGKQFDSPDRQANQPAFTVTSNSNQAGVRAILVSSIDCTSRESVEPSNTVVAVGDGHSIPPRAFLMRAENAGQEGQRQGRYLDEPFYAPDDPAMTVRAGQKSTPSSLTFGRVVRMNPRALARFMGIPDSYILPDANGLACEIIGNCVPPLLAKAICESLR